MIGGAVSHLVKQNSTAVYKNKQKRSAGNWKKMLQFVNCTKMPAPVEEFMATQALEMLMDLDSDNSCFNHNFESNLDREANVFGGTKWDRDDCDSDTWTK